MDGCASSLINDMKCSNKIYTYSEFIGITLEAIDRRFHNVVKLFGIFDFWLKIDEFDAENFVKNSSHSTIQIFITSCNIHDDKCNNSPRDSFLRGSQRFHPTKYSMGNDSTPILIIFDSSRKSRHIFRHWILLGYSV